MREILFRLPSSIEVAEALAAVPPGPHQETVRRMAMAVDLLRDGGWEVVKGSTPAPPKALPEQPLLGQEIS